jgi:hypothetical protein
MQRTRLHSSEDGRSVDRYCPQSRPVVPVPSPVCRCVSRSPERSVRRRYCEPLPSDQPQTCAEGSQRTGMPSENSISLRLYGSSCFSRNDPKASRSPRSERDSKILASGRGPHPPHCSVQDKPTVTTPAHCQQSVIRSFRPRLSLINITTLTVRMVPSKALDHVSVESPIKIIRERRA